MHRDRSASSGAAEELWHFAVEAYARPGVRPLCIDLQDRHGAGVMVLLLLSWLAARGEDPKRIDVRAIAGHADLLERHLLAPLRAARRALALAGPAFPACAGAAARVLARELAQERLQAELLAGCIGPPSARASAGSGVADRACSGLFAYLCHLGVAQALARESAQALSAAVFADARASGARV